MADIYEIEALEKKLESIESEKIIELADQIRRLLMRWAHKCEFDRDHNNGRATGDVRPSIEFYQQVDHLSRQYQLQVNPDVFPVSLLTGLR